MNLTTCKICGKDVFSEKDFCKVSTSVPFLKIFSKKVSAIACAECVKNIFQMDEVNEFLSN